MKPTNIRHFTRYQLNVIYVAEGICLIESNHPEESFDASLEALYESLMDKGHFLQLKRVLVFDKHALQAVTFGGHYVVHGEYLTKEMARFYCSVLPKLSRYAEEHQVEWLNR